MVRRLAFAAVFSPRYRGGQEGIAWGVSEAVAGVLHGAR